MPRTIKLSKPLQTHKGDVTEIELRDITAADLVEARTSPIVISYIRSGTGNNALQETKIEQRYDLMMTLASKLTGIDEILLSVMSGKDFRKVCDEIGGAWREAEGE